MTAPAKKTAPAEKPTIPELERAWATAADQAETATKERDRLRQELIDLGVEVGHSSDYLIVDETGRIDPHNPKLAEALEKVGQLAKVSESSISTRKLHAAAELDQQVAAIVARYTKKTPRFRRASKLD